MSATPYSPFDSVSELMADRAARHGDDRALIVAGADYSYARVWDRAAEIQGWLWQSGVRPGDRVAVFMRNSVEFIDAWLGVMRAGAIAVPVNTSMVGRSLAHVLLHSGATGIFVDADLADQVDLAGPLPELRWRVVRGSAGTAGTTFVDLRQARLGGRPPEPASALTPMNIIYTSGTTGPPKGVVLAHVSYLNTGSYFGRHLGLRPDDILHTCLPLFHCNAQQTTLMVGLSLRATVAIDEKFSLSQFWPRIRACQATTTNLLGAMLTLLHKAAVTEQERGNTLRYILSAPVPAELHRPLEKRLGVRIVEGYGLTETATMACINPPDDTRSGTIGRPLEYNELRVVDDRDQSVPDGQPGQLITRTSIPGSYMLGYYEAPEQTAEAMAGGWFHTGDLVSRREDGWFVFHDRLKDTIRRRGENISSYFVEEAVLANPGILEAAAIGVPSELSEEDVKVVAVRRPGSELSEEDLAVFCDGQLPDFMRPRYIEFRDALPRTETGRVHKYVLRAEGPGPAWDRVLAGRPAEPEPTDPAKRSAAR